MINRLTLWDDLEDNVKTVNFILQKLQNHKSIIQNTIIIKQEELTKWIQSLNNDIKDLKDVHEIFETWRDEVIKFVEENVIASPGNYTIYIHSESDAIWVDKDNVDYTEDTEKVISGISKESGEKYVQLVEKEKIERSLNKKPEYPPF